MCIFMFRSLYVVTYIRMCFYARVCMSTYTYLIRAAVSPGFPAVSPGFSDVSPGFSAVSPGFATVSPGFAAVSPGFAAVSPGITCLLKYMYTCMTTYKHV